MITAQFSNVSFGYHDKQIVDGFTYQIKHNCRVGIIGPNGAGKTTLIRLLIRQLEPDMGEITCSRDIRIGVLEQMPGHIPPTPLGELLETPFRKLIDMESRLRGLETDMSSNSDESVHKRYDQILNQFKIEGGYSYKAKIQEVLSGLGFNNPDLKRPLNSFSGGEQSRLMLARLLLEDPELLLLDEPTNHLDISAVEWLESYLKSYRGGVIIISHDRYFLDSIATEILELMHRKITVYPGNYSSYLVQKKARLEQLEKQYDLQQLEIHRMEDFIRRNMAGQKTKQAQSRLKALEKMDRIDAPQSDPRSMRLKIETPHAGGRIVLETEKLGKRFPDKSLFSGATLRLERGRIAGVIGPNGCGKTTFLKMLNGQIPVEEGEVIFGYKIQQVTYDQKLDDLNPENDLIEEIRTLKPWMTEFEVRSHLGLFLFSGEDVFKKIKQLSGGEKARVSLAKLVLRKANLLLLDEPTNHLDLDAREILESAILDFPGSIIMVTHDRYLLDRTADLLWVFENGTITEHAGNYSDFRAIKEKQTTSASGQKEPSSDAKPTKKDIRKTKANIRSRTGKSSKYYEREIEKLDLELAEIHNEMKNPALAVDWIALDSLASHERDVKTRLEELIVAWEMTIEEEKILDNQ